MFENCCVCMNKDANLNCSLKCDTNNVPVLEKLKLCVPEVDWLDAFQICELCNRSLDVVFSFRQTCLNSDIIRKRTIEEETSLDSSTKELFAENGSSPQKEIDNTDVSEPELLSDNNALEPNPVKKRNRRTWKFKCECCDKVFNTSTKLVAHSVSEHLLNSKDIKPYNCTICNGKFGTSSYLTKHLKYHEGNRIHMCTFCGKGFITKTDLNIHEKQHLNKREYKCEHCSKCYNTPKDIRTHKLVVHTSPSLWTHICNICNKPFPIKSNYDNHMRRHTGDKRFSCHICDKRFTDKCVLQKHLKSHSNVREYKCVECKKEYKDKRIMEIHMAKLHGIGDVKIPVREKKFYCHICPKSYFAKNKLTRHLYTHSGERPFFCSICEKKFTDKSYVKQHMRNIHNVIEEID